MLPCINSDGKVAHLLLAGRRFAFVFFSLSGLTFYPGNLTLILNILEFLGLMIKMVTIVLDYVF